MRNFFCKSVKSISIIYLCFVAVLSYRLIYNEYYTEIHKGVETSQENETFVYPLGEIVGLYMECDGVFVIDTCEIETKDNDFVSPAGGVLRAGDYILEVNGISLEDKEVLVKEVNTCKGNPLELTVVRGESTFQTNVTPVLGKNGKYMLGVWVKDDLAGVGSITYYTREGDFAALGHGMGDGVTKELLSVKGGEVFVSEVVGIEKGQKGTPGEVKGIIYYGTKNHLGVLDTNSGEGIYGMFDPEDRNRFLAECDAYAVAGKEEIEVGKAQIISSVSGMRQIYDIEITYVDYLAVTSNKGLHIQVTDETLLELTGGIVQGMFTSYNGSNNRKASKIKGFLMF